MPFFYTESTGPGQALAVWHITELESDLAFLSFESCPEDLVHPEKRLEWLAGRALIKKMMEDFDLPYQGLRKDEFGKPFLKGGAHQISLSHSFPFVAAQIDPSQSVGIDLEQPKEKLRQIAPRVFSEGEVKDAGDNLIKLCIYWCAKEALYKIYGKRNLLFTDHLQVMPFTLGSRGTLTGKIVFNDEKNIVQLEYRIQKEFVLVFTGKQSVS